MVTDLRCWRLISLYWWFSQCMKLFTFILKWSPTSQTCHQHIWFPTSVTNIDVTLPSPWACLALSYVEDFWMLCRILAYHQCNNILYDANIWPNEFRFLSSLYWNIIAKFSIVAWYQENYTISWKTNLKWQHMSVLWIRILRFRFERKIIWWIRWFALERRTSRKDHPNLGRGWLWSNSQFIWKLRHF